MIEDDSCVRNNIYMSPESNFSDKKLTEEGIRLLAEVSCHCKARAGGEEGVLLSDRSSWT